MWWSGNRFKKSLNRAASDGSASSVATRGKERSKIKVITAKLVTNVICKRKAYMN